LDLYGVDSGKDPLTVLVPAWMSKSVGQSTPVAETTNTISVTLKLNYHMAAGSKITISGLTGSATASNSNLPISSSCNYGTTGNWNSDGTLILTAVSGGNSAGVACIVSLDLVNGRNQTSPTVQISTTIVDDLQKTLFSLSEEDMDKDTGDKQGVTGGATPLFIVIPKFTRKIIRQLNPLTDVLNTLIVILSANCDFPTGSVVKISGLLETKTASTLCLTLSGTSADTFGSGRCAGWHQNTGELSMTLQIPLSSGQQYSFNLEVQNPAAEQSSPDVLISASIKSLVAGGVDGQLDSDSMQKDLVTSAYGV
jgi:hypothetical protein